MKRHLLLLAGYLGSGLGGVGHHPVCGMQLTVGLPLLHSSIDALLGPISLYCECLCSRSNPVVDGEATAFSMIVRGSGIPPPVCRRLCPSPSGDEGSLYLSQTMRQRLFLTILSLAHHCPRCTPKYSRHQCLWMSNQVCRCYCLGSVAAWMAIPFNHVPTRSGSAVSLDHVMSSPFFVVENFQA